MIFLRNPVIMNISPKKYLNSMPINLLKNAKNV